MRATTAVVGIVLLSAVGGMVGTAAGTATVAQTDTPTPRDGVEYDTNLTTGSVHWEGQQLYFRGANATGTYTVREVDGGDEVGDYVRELETDDGVVVIDTGRIGTGEYVIVDDDGDVVQTNESGIQTGAGDPDGADVVARSSFEVVEQRLTARADRDTIGLGEGIDVSLTSNRDDYAVEITSLGLSSTDLRYLFGGTETDNGVRLEVTDEPISATFWNVETGVYRFQFEAVDADARGSVTVRVEEANEIRLRTETLRTTAGTVVPIELTCRRGERGQLVVGTGERGYRSVINFSDDDYDGHVALEMNTYLAGNHRGTGEAAAWSAPDDDEITNVDLQSERLDDPLEPVGYDLSVQVDGEERDVGLLVLRSATMGELRTGTIQGDEFGKSPGEVPSVETDRVAVGDVLYLNVTAPGVFGLLDAQPGDDDPTDQFQSLVESDEAALSLTRREVNGGQPEPELDLAGSIRQEVLEVVPDRTNGRLTILLDTDEIQFRDGRTGTRAGERLDVEFELTEESRLVDGDETVSASVTMTDRSLRYAEYEGVNRTVRATDTAAIRGETTVAPGTELYFRLRLNGTLTRGIETTAGTDRQFTVPLNLSNVTAGTRVHISPANFETAAEAVVRPDPAEISEPTPTPTATPTVTRTPTPSTPESTPTPSPTPNTPTLVPTAAERAGDRTATARTPTRSATAGSGPGFGPSVTLVALLGVTLLGVRRRQT